MTAPETIGALPGTPEIPPVSAAMRETELKFALTAPAFNAAQQWEKFDPAVRRPRARRLMAVYFDTAAGDLARHKASLRVRTVNRRHVITFKWTGSFAGGWFERGEVEAASPTPELDIALLPPEIAQAIIRLTAGRKLEAVYSSDIKRVVRLLHDGTGTIEMAFDSGVISAGDKTCPVREVEMEFKSGDAGALYRLGLDFVAAFPARLESLSKAERGAALASGKAPEAVRAVAGLQGEPVLDGAIGALINACLGQFIANWPAFESGDAVKAVHQMRVAMRRLRSVLGLFQRAFPSAGFTVFREQARNIANAMGEARNWDVFAELLKTGPAAAFPGEAGFETLLAGVAQYRIAGHDAVRSLLGAAETLRFVLSLQGFAATHGWRNALAGEALPELSVPARDFADTSLARLHRRLLRDGKNITHLSAEQRHELRKDLKKLRYTVDLFGGLFDARKQIAAYGKSLSKLQDRLGVFNDLAVARELALRLDAGDDVAASRAAGIVIGWCARGAVEDDEGLRRMWKKVRRLKPFE
ncbi:inorganic triphosphatase [Acidocella aquatica]|uniref:Inorganic triphosphatase n=1 Tax=Acidocella aquatica TaxID=1922313 RepID=A0ABQ6A3Y9_9PROT|nr:CYTH and CHAD domain-containing protein [Acidocella aquatica]GLR66377.1 inorganic triphosphatase [Acidocella aquatica]